MGNSAPDYTVTLEKHLPKHNDYVDIILDLI